jgi:hypothetical protein
VYIRSFSSARPAGPLVRVPREFREGWNVVSKTESTKARFITDAMAEPMMMGIIVVRNALFFSLRTAGSIFPLVSTFNTYITNTANSRYKLLLFTRLIELWIIYP